MCINVWKKSVETETRLGAAHLGRHASFFADSVASTTYLVGHKIFIFFVELQKNKTSKKTSMATEQVGVQFSQFIIHRLS